METSNQDGPGSSDPIEEVSDINQLIDQPNDISNQIPEFDIELDKSNVEKLRTIAESGTVNIEWTELQSVLTTRLEKVLADYAKCKKTNIQDEEDDVDAFRTEFLSLISSFTEPPFTIQRICELLISPFEYYYKATTFLRGLEKNLRVISSNDWSKSQVCSKSDVNVIIPVKTNETDETSQPEEKTHDDPNDKAGDNDKDNGNDIDCSS